MAFPDVPMPGPAPRLESQFVLEAYRQVRRRNRVWLHVLLLFLTLVTTAAVGSRFQFNFDQNLPPFDVDRDWDALLTLWQHPAALVSGLPFALTLLTILFAHEMGHYVACLYYGIDASLPYFLPAPTFTGTLGAFIRIRSPIYSRRQLFDVGIAGPLAGFLFLLPALGVGLAFSKVLPGIGTAGSLSFGTPPVLWLLERAIFPGVHAADLYLHPIARAAWVGVFATALNLLPIGQLDGGHIVYSLFSRRHKLITRLAIAALVPIGVFYWHGWLFWAALLFLFARRHPSIYDRDTIGSVRAKLGWLGLAIFLLSFTLAPIVQRF